MSEMIERVADAMIAKWRIHAMPGQSPDVPYWQDMARTAFEVIREPTAAMLAAGADAEGEEWSKGGDTVKIPYQAMIDAALEGK